jgi:hypothetical protein
MTVLSRPHRLTRMCWGLAVFVVAIFATIGAGLRSAPEGDAQFQLADQIAMTLLGVVIGGAALLLTRPRVVADAEGVRVRNVLGFTHFPWAVVAAVRFEDGASWASLDLQDDDNVALLAIQSNDGDRAVDAVLGLRRLLAASRTAP